MGGLLGSGELAEHVLGRGHAELAGRLDDDDAGDAVLGVQGKALGAHAHAEGTCVHFQPQRARELAVAVETGHAYCRARVCKCWEISVGALSFTKKLRLHIDLQPTSITTLKP